ncbi:MAG: DUF1801 domain-containing protein [Salibacteraceae bacterium]
MEGVNTSFYTKWEGPVNSCLQTLQYLILSFNSEIKETTKYGMVCFTVQNKPKFYLGIDLKKNNEPYVLFVNGNKIDSHLLEQGSRKKMKIYRVDPIKDINKTELYNLLQIAIEL